MEYRPTLRTLVATLALVALAGPPLPAQAEPAAETPTTLFVEAVDSTGKSVRAEGHLSRGSRHAADVTTGSALTLDPGRYELTLGVRTMNGNLYAPVSRDIDVVRDQETRVSVQVKLPPTVTARFEGPGEKLRPSLVRAYQGGEERFKFRADTAVFVDEGRYEFRARPLPQNDLSVEETVAAGENKTVVFDIGTVARVKVKLVAADTGEWFRQRYELWRDGKHVYSIDPLAGAHIPPGTYDLHLNDRLTPWVVENLVVTREPEQSFEFEVPIGHVVVTYLKADGQPDAARDCLIGRDADGEGHYRPSGRRVPLTPGTYNVTGIGAGYDRLTFEVRKGEEAKVELRARGN